MMEVQISPLAKRLAEENSIDWRVIRGTGPEGRVIERDILTYLAKIMSGEIDPPALPDASETPPPVGMSAPDIGSISNLAAASAGMAREGIDLGSLLNNAPVVETPSASSFTAPRYEAPLNSDPVHAEPARLEQSSFQTPGFAASSFEVPTTPEVSASPMMFEEPAPIAPVVDAAPGSLESISFGDPTPASSLHEISFADSPAVAEPEMSFASPSLPELNESLEDRVSMQVSSVAETPVVAPAFPPPLTPADSGVEFEIDLDDLDDLDAQPEMAVATPEPTAPEHALVPVLETAAEVHPHEDDLVLDVSADVEHTHAIDIDAAPVSLEESTFHDDLVIEEIAPVITDTPVAASDVLDDFEIDLDEPEVMLESAEPIVAEPVFAEPVLTEPVLDTRPIPSEVAPSFTESVYTTPVEFNTPSFEAVEPAVDLNPEIEPVAPAFTMPALETVAPVAALAATGIVAAPPETQQPETHPVSSQSVPSSRAAPVATGYYQGFAVRRHFDAAALNTMQGQLSSVLNGRDVPLEIFLARAAQRHAHLLGMDNVTLARIGDALEPVNASGLFHSFVEAVRSVAQVSPASAHGLLVVDASHLGADDLVLPGDAPVLSLNVKGDHGHLSLAGNVSASKAAEFLGRVSESLEMPVSLVI
jgi:hypothetical protein